MSMNMNDESNKLLAKMELENGGKLEFRTYAHFVGKSGEKIKNLGGLLFFVGDRLIFEDFERQTSSLLLMFRKKSEYIKLKFQITVSEIERIDLVNLSQAIRVVKYGSDPKHLTVISGLRKILFRNVTQVLLKDGNAFYFEIFDLKGFTSFMSEQIR